MCSLAFDAKFVRPDIMGFVILLCLTVCVLLLRTRKVVQNNLVF